MTTYNDTDMMEKEDIQLKDEALQKITEPTQTICTNSRHNLTEVFKRL